MDTPGLLSRNGFGQDNRKRNIVLFRGLDSEKYKRGMDLTGVRLRTGSLGEEAISTMFWIPQIKKPFQAAFGNPFAHKSHEHEQRESDPT
jgi:hypothetical protein